MVTNGAAQPSTPSVELEPLSKFVGVWNTKGEIRASSSGPATTMHAVDRYEWLPGGFFLIHRWDAEMPDGRIQGIEIIGYDVASKSYLMHSFDSRGNTGLMMATVDGDRWDFEGPSLRFTGAFRDAGRTFSGLWQQRSSADSDWAPWMDMVLTRAERDSI